MKLGENIKKYREVEALSQEMLAEKVYVTRQTVSNWENNKSYPDINSLLLLAETFHISLDNLVKGDVETMKKIINEKDINRFNKLSTLYTIAFIVLLVSLVPLDKYFGKIGWVIWGVFGVITMVIAMKVEREKKKHDIQTYKEIVAFTEGKKLDEISKAREEGKRPYQKLLYFVGAAVIGFATAMIMVKIFS